MFLLGGTVVSLLAEPLVETYRYERAALAPFFLLFVVVGIGGVPGRRRRGVAWIAAPIAIAWFLARLTRLIIPVGHEAQLRVAAVLGLALTGIVFATLIRGLTTVRRIRAGILAEAFTGYLLLALAFAQIYSVLSGLLPVTFNTAPPPGAAMVYFVYFSLVTIAGIGFGDIVPTNAFVRVIAALEGVCGLFYTAVIIARLVAARSLWQMPAAAADSAPACEHLRTRQKTATGSGPI